MQIAFSLSLLVPAAWAAVMPLNVTCFDGDVFTPSSSFSSSLARKDWTLLFYADWCTHCQKFAPIFEQLETELEDMKFGKVNLNAANRELGVRFDISGTVHTGVQLHL